MHCWKSRAPRKLRPDNSRGPRLIWWAMDPLKTDPFRSKGAVEQETPLQEGNESIRGQLPHRNQDPLLKSHDTDFPVRGENPEHTGEPESASLYMRDEPGRESDAEDSEGAQQDQDPGYRQKQNQSDEKDDSLAA